jgi:hypothetical protein
MHSGDIAILERCLNRQFVSTASRVSMNTETRIESEHSQFARNAYSLCSDAALDNSSSAPSRRPDAIIKREIAFEFRLYSMILLRSDFRTRIFWANSPSRVASGYDPDPAVLMCPPCSLQRNTCERPVRVWTNDFRGRYRHLPSRTIHDLPDAVSRIHHTGLRVAASGLSTAIQGLLFGETEQF